MFYNILMHKPRYSEQFVMKKLKKIEIWVDISAVLDRSIPPIIKLYPRIYSK